MERRLVILNRKRQRLLGAVILCSIASASAQAESPGVTATEIKLGTIQPFSGPASSYSVSGKASEAYFDKINAEGGINGRKVRVISADDAYSPPKTVEQARKLVESDEVLLLFNTFGTPSNIAILKYMNARKVPQLFVGSGGTMFGLAKQYPWTMGFRPNYRSEGAVYARYILKEKPDAKIAVLYAHDDSGKDPLSGLKAGLGDKANMIVAEANYESGDPTVDSQLVSLKASGADVLMLFASNKFAAQAIRKVAEIAWKPQIFVYSPANSTAAVLKPAGFEASQGIITATYVKDPDDPEWKDDAGVKSWRAFMEKYYPKGDQHDISVLSGYNYAQTLTYILQQCKDDLSRENVMKQAENIKGFPLDMLLPGITVNTSPTDHYPIEQMQLARFEGERWVLFDDVVDGSLDHQP